MRYTGTSYPAVRSHLPLRSFSVLSRSYLAYRGRYTLKIVPLEPHLNVLLWRLAAGRLYELPREPISSSPPSHQADSRPVQFPHQLQQVGLLPAGTGRNRSSQAQSMDAHKSFVLFPHFNWLIVVKGAQFLRERVGGVLDLAPSNHVVPTRTQITTHIQTTR